MKAIKKLLAAALVCVMALSMLTGCAVADKSTEKNMVKAMNDAAGTSLSYTRTDEMDKKAAEYTKKAGDLKNWNGKEDSLSVAADYTLYIAELPNDWFNSQKTLKEIAGKAHTALKSCKQTDKKISIGVDVKELNGKNYVFVIAKNA